MKTQSLSFASALLSQYRVLVSARQNVPSVIEECFKLADLFGSRGLLFLLRVVLEDFDVKSHQQDTTKLRILEALFEKIYPSLFCQAVLTIGVSPKEYLTNLTKRTSLPLGKQIQFALSVAKSSQRAWREEGARFLSGKVPEIAKNLDSLPFTTLQELLVYSQSNSDGFVLSEETSAKLLSAISSSAGQPIPLELLPLVGGDPALELFREKITSQNSTDVGEYNMANPNPINMANSLAGVMEELGYSCTSNEANFRAVLNQFQNIDECAVAQVLGMVARTHTGLEDQYGMMSSFTAVLGNAGGPGSAPGTTSLSWNVDLVVDVLKSTQPNLDWVKVAAEFDHDGFNLPDQDSFAVLIRSYKLGNPEPFPLDTVLGKVWENARGQVSFLKHAVVAPPELFTFEHSWQKLSPVEGLHGGKSPVGTPNNAWVSLDLMETLCKLGDGGQLVGVRQILEGPLQSCQEVLLLSAGSVQTDWGVVQEEVFEQLVPVFILAHPNSLVVLHRLWPITKEAIIKAMVNLYDKDIANISRVLDVCQELKALTQVLDSTSYVFAAELAALASRREYLNLEKWLKDKISSDGMPFVEAVLGFLDFKLSQQALQQASQQRPPAAVGRINLSVETLVLFMRVLQMNASVFPNDMSNNIKKVQLKAVQIYPELQGMNPHDQAEVFASDIEEEANSYFHKIYSEQTRLEDVIQMLKQYKGSAEQRDKEVFACMIHNLFDEYRFFPKYPDKELHITAVLFGQLIHHQLVSSITLGIALRCVLDALKKPPDSKMFKFGLSAIHQFKKDLPGWPQYCSYVIQIAQVREADPELVTFIENALKEQGLRGGDASAQAGKREGTASPSVDQNGVESMLSASTRIGINPPGQSAGSSGETSSVPDSAKTPVAQGAGGESGSKATARVTENGGSGKSEGDESGGPPNPPPAPSLAAINAQTLELAAREYCQFPEPPEKIRDKVAFIFNNLSAQNMDEKVKTLRDTVTDESLEWLANYVVVKRAAQEQNFHHLYVRLLDQLANRKLLDFIVQTTYHYVGVLLDKDRIKSEMSDRSLLKNLGSWLGQMTLAKNKPVRQKDIDLKAIIYEAYERGKMVAVIPFVHKVLEQGKESKVYGAHNPWIKGILTLLAEIYRLEGLKMNLTFEIEMIFKDFNLNIDDIPPSKTLDGVQRESVNNPDFYDNRKPAQSSPQPMATPAAPTPPPSEPPAPSPVQAPAMQAALEARSAGLDAGVEPVPPGPRTNGLSTFQNVPPSISGSTVVYTDAATILSALAGTLHQLVTISPSLSAINERLPLKRLISVGIDRAIYEIITPVVERSVMIACTTTKELVTKDFAMEPDEQKVRKAAHLMVSSLAGSLALVTCKEPLKVSLQSHLKSVLQGVLDPTILDQTIGIVIADNLDLGCTIIEKASTDKAIKEVDERLLPYYQSRQKARAAGTPFYDMSIFTKGGGRFPASLPESLRPRPGHLNTAQTKVYDDFARIPRSNHNFLKLAGVAESGMNQMEQQEPMLSQFKPDTLVDRYTMWQARLDAAVAKENPSSEYSQLPEGSEVNTVLTEFIELVRMGQNRDEVVQGIAEKLFIHLYDRPTRMSVSVICAALSLLKNAGFSRLGNELTHWYCQINQDESRRFNRTVADGLIRADLMVFPDLDMLLARYISNAGGPLPGSVDFILHLVTQYIIIENILRHSDLASTLEVLRKLAAQSQDGERIIQLIDQVRNVPKDADPDGLRDQVAALFDKWAKVVHAEPTDKNITACIDQFVKTGLLKGDDITSRFFRICAELSVLHCVNTEGANQQGQKVGDGRMSYVMIDSFVKLVVTLLEVLKGGVQGLRKILEIIVLVLYRDHDNRGTLFNSRPYFRIFYGLYEELLSSDMDDVGSLDILGAIASALVSCRPQRVPGFTFSWLELVSHRKFMARLLKYPERRGWPYFRALFMGLLLFMQPYLRHAELGDTLRLLYNGVMRVMLVLLHDFPEFLCDYHVELCNVIPPSCVQMRNLILSAFPSHMRLPDPFTPNLKVDLLADINKEPKIFPDVAQLLPAELKNGIDQYIKSHGPQAFLDSLPQRLMLSPEAEKVEGTAYNVTLMNCVVLYTGILAIRAVQNKAGASLVQYGPAMDIFHKLANDLDTEGRYLFLNAIANQLRFPNSHTHYFSCVLLVLFLEAQARVLQEQITRVLLERLIVHRPHPWGLLITFIELIKNKRYRFWELGITRCAPEIEHLFESVARSCLPSPPEGMVQDENGVAVQSAVRALD